MLFNNSDLVYINARDLCLALQAEGHEALLAGGCVRDSLLGRKPKDYDVATSATPEQVEQLFPHTVGVGRSFGVVLVVLNNHEIEVATFREDASSSDGRHPDHVSFTTAKRDAKRRDFTINGLFFDPKKNVVLDFVNGQIDLRKGCLRTIGSPRERFQEDYLRMLRAARFASTLGFTISQATGQAIREQASNIQSISPERIERELTRLLVESPKAGQGVRLLLDLNLLHHILPEVCNLVGQEQPPQFHPEGDVFMHTTMMLDTMQQVTPTLAYAVLLHDIGKPATATTTIEPDGTDRIRFNGHDNVGAEIARAIMTRLRMPRDRLDAVVHCVANHMRFMHVQNMRRATLRRLIGAKTFPVEIELHRLDCLCSHGDTSNVDFLLEQKEAFHNEPVLPQRWITGWDIMARGVPKGPMVGHWVRTCYSLQLDDKVSSRDELLAWLDQQDLLNEIPPS